MDTLCSALFWQMLDLLSVRMCLSCHVGQKERTAAAGKELLLSRVVKELSVRPGHDTVWPWARAGCLALILGSSFMELPHGPSPIITASTEQ